MQLEDIKKNQLLASNPNFSTWVFASAGSGKTRILVNRILRLLLNSTSPEKILCLTFTKAGANEMEERINNDLIKWAKLDDIPLTNSIREICGNTPSFKEVKKAQSLILKMFENDLKIKIQTIHSFCQSLLKIFAFEANISPNFEVLEDNSQQLLLKKAIDNIIQNSKNDNNLHNILIEIFAIKNYDDIFEITKDLIDKKDELNSTINYHESIANLTNEIYNKFNINSDLTIEQNIAKFKEHNSKDTILQLVNFYSNSKNKTDHKILLNINDFYNNKISFEKYYNLFFTNNNTLRKPSKSLLQDQKALLQLNNHTNSILEYYDQIKSIKICHETRLIIYFSSLAIKYYDELKNNKNLLDYDDLINKTNKLLQNPNFNSWIQMKMDSSYEHILIDESQDTNIKQWQIINLLCDDFFSGDNAAQNNRSIFVVGDEKQSIYSFQGAQSDISYKIYQYYNKNNSNLLKIELNNSFRSATSILKNIDHIFSQPQYFKSLISSNNYQNHRAVRNIKGKFEIWPQINDVATQDNEDYNWKSNNKTKISSKELLAEYIAKKIKYEVTTKKKLENSQKNVTYSDYMILLRNKTNGFDQEITKSFNKYNIPYSSQSRINFSDSLIIQDFLAISKFTLNKNDNLNLASLLKSPFFNLTDQDLVKIIYHDQKANIIDNISLIKEYFESYKKLLYFKECAINSNLQNFYYEILYNSYNEEIFCNNYGSQFLEIRDKFYNIVKNFGLNNFNNLQKFIQFCDDCNPQISLKSHDDNSAKILTIHSSKGLQSPIVIIPDCSYSASKLRSAKENISWINFDDNEPLIPIWCSNSKDSNDIINKHKIKIQNDAFDEYLRLLYVAMTRAEDELYIAAFGNDNDEKSWYQIIKNSTDKRLLNNNIFVEIDQSYQKIANNHNINKYFEEISFKPANIYQKKLNIENNSTNLSTIKGEIIHNIIDFINKNYLNEQKWLKFQSNLIIANSHIITKNDKIYINKIIAKYIASEFFSNLSKYKIASEVEIKHNNSIKRIDLIIFKENIIEIIDFKSDKKVPKKVSRQYIDQLMIYKSAIKKQYSNYDVKGYIIWLTDCTIKLTC